MAKQPRPVHELVGQVFREHQRQEHLTLVTLQRNWATLVGPGLAERTWPARLQQGLLWIAAPDSSWAYQLQFLKAELLAGIQLGLPGAGVNELRFKVGLIPAPLDAGDAAPGADGTRQVTPAPTRNLVMGSSREGETHGSESSEQAVPAPHAAFSVDEPPSPDLAHAAESIADPILRKAFLHAMGKQARRQTEKA
jgi:hypothetical protein